MAARPWPAPPFAAALIQWLRTVPPATLAAWADADADMVALLGRQVPGGPAVARTLLPVLLGPGAVAAARAATAATWTALLDAIADSLPEHGAILLCNDAWFRREMERIQAAICGGGA
jgi:hypothetical protein